MFHHPQGTLKVFVGILEVQLGRGAVHPGALGSGSWEKTADHFRTHTEAAATRNESGKVFVESEKVFVCVFGRTVASVRPRGWGGDGCPK